MSLLQADGTPYTICYVPEKDSMLCPASMRHECMLCKSLCAVAAAACVDVKLTRGLKDCFNTGPLPHTCEHCFVQVTGYNPAQPAAIRTLDVFPKSLREVQSSNAEPSEAPRAVTPEKAQLLR